MSAAFLGVMFLAMLLLAFWRITLVVLAAILVAAVVTGLGIVTDDLAGSTDQPTTTIEYPIDTGPPVLGAEPPR